MARRKYAKKSAKRKTRRTKKKVGDSVTSIQKQLICANRQIVRLRYMDVDTPTISLAGGVNNYNLNQYKINSAWDVNTALASSAMPGFTGWSTFYERYRVLKCKVTFEVCNNSAAFQPIYMLLHCQTDAAPPSFTSWGAIRLFEGNPNTKVKLLSSTTGQDHGKLSMTVDFVKLIGSKKAYEADLEYAGFTNVLGIGADPVALLHAYCYILTGSGNPIVGTTAFPVRVTIEQEIEFFTRVDKQQ